MAQPDAEPQTVRTGEAIDPAERWIGSSCQRHNPNIRRHLVLWTYPTAAELALYRYSRPQFVRKLEFMRKLALDYSE